MRISAPLEADEGQGIPLEVTVSDEDGAVTFSWDLDGDGSYGEATGETSVTLPSGTTDGPSSVTVGVQAVGPSETTTESATISVLNVAPTLTGQPPTEAGVRREYRFDSTIDEPAGERDPVALVLTSRPMGMEIVDGAVVWTPEPDQRGRTFPAILRATDDEDATGVQRWEVTVAANTAPFAPVPVRPVRRERMPEGEPVTLRVDNGVDLDEDPLQYIYTLSRTSDFDGDSVFVSAAVEEGERQTLFVTDGPLERGLWYWSVVATDGMEESPPAFAQLVIGDAVFGDGGTGPIDEGGGCAVARPETGTRPIRAGLLGLLVLVFLRRRR
ncbi:MAG: hypothetical protein AB8I08_24550 [Sandaracinaceae bacterium]